MNLNSYLKSRYGIALDDLSVDTQEAVESFSKTKGGWPKSQGVVDQFLVNVVGLHRLTFLNMILLYINVRLAAKIKKLDDKIQELEEEKKKEAK